MQRGPPLRGPTRNLDGDNLDAMLFESFIGHHIASVGDYRSRSDG